MDVPPSIFPNPFDRFINSTFTLEKRSEISIRLFDISGNFVYAIIENKGFEKGTHTVTWQSDIASIQFNSAVYVLLVEIDGSVVSRDKLVKIRR